MDRSSIWFTVAGTFLGLGAGCAMALQPAANGRLSSQCGHPLQASIISFGTGLLALLSVALLLRIGLPSVTNLRTLPAWAWGGGLLGTYMVTVSLTFAPVLGATRWIALVLTGQIILSLFLDHYGLFGYAQHGLSWSRIIGLLCLATGVVIVMRN